MRKILKKEFFKKPAVEVAESLLGKVLVRKIGKKTLAVKITELEIYDGFEDKASHASRGKTERNKIMFEEGGYFYVYLIYGMYWMINIVVGKKDHPSAILLRGGEVVTESKNNFLDGPGKLSRFLKIDKKFDRKLATLKNNLWFEDWGIKVSKNKIKRTARIGVNYAGSYWSNKKWRFLIKD